MGLYFHCICLQFFLWPMVLASYLFSAAAQLSLALRPQDTQEMFILSESESAVTTRGPSTVSSTAVGPKRTASPELTTAESVTMSQQGKAWGHLHPAPCTSSLITSISVKRQSGFSLSSLADCLWHGLCLSEASVSLPGANNSACPPPWKSGDHMSVGRTWSLRCLPSKARTSVRQVRYSLA